MNIPRLVLSLSAVAFLGFGIFLFLLPASLVSLVDLNGPLGASATAEIRAMYGGLEIGLAAFLFWSAARPVRQRAGLAASLFCFLGLASGRLGGIVLADGPVARAVWIALFAEVVAAALSYWALTRLRD